MVSPGNLVAAAFVAAASVSSAALPMQQAETRRQDSVQIDSSDQVSNELSSLGDFLRYAALNNAGLEAAFNRWKAALEEVDQVESLPDPRFSYVHFIEEVETRVGPQRRKVSVTQMFPWFGKLRLSGTAAAEAAAAAGQEYEKVKFVLFYRVKKAYYEYWYLAQAIDVTEEHIRLVGNMESVARARFKTGAAPNSAVIQAQVELGKLDDRLRTLRSLREPIAAGLNAALSRPGDMSLPRPASLPEFSASFTDDQAMDWLAAGNPDLQRLDHVVAKEEAGIRLAAKSYYPDISLGVDYVETDDALMPNTPESGKDPVMAMVSINLPIWYGKYRAAERQARYRKLAAEKSREDAGRQLEADLKMVLYHFRDAERKVDLYRDTLVPKAKQSLQVARQAFEGGKAGFISLVDVQRLLMEFQLAGMRALADRGQRLAEIEMMLGRDLASGAGEKEGVSK